MNDENQQIPKGYYFVSMPPAGHYESILSDNGDEAGRMLLGIGVTLATGNPATGGNAAAGGAGGIAGLLGTAVGGSIGFMVDTKGAGVATVISTLSKNIDTLFDAINDPSWLPPDINGN
jgi:hypothetical protein